MQIQIKAKSSELKDHTKVGLAITKVIDKIDPRIRDFLVKSDTANKSIKSEIGEPVVLEFLKQWELSYKEHTDRMIDDIGDVFDKAAKKSLDDTTLEKGGPYIGPRGGKWADPDHTIPWKEEYGFKDTGERYSDEEAFETLSKIGNSLYQNQMESAMGGYAPKDSEGLSHYDMNLWPKASTLKDMRRVLKKYKRQISEGYGLKEYHKLGLADKEKMLSKVTPYYHKNYGSLQLPVDGFINRKLFGDYLQVNKKYGAKFDRVTRVWYIPENDIDDFDFDSYRSELYDIGIAVGEIKGERKKKKTKEELDKAWEDLSIDEAFNAVQNKIVPNGVILKKTGDNKFSFYFPYNEPLNELFRNRDPREGEKLIHGIRLSGIMKANPGEKKGDLWGRETSDVYLIEEALDKIKTVVPDFKIAIDPSFKEAQDRRDRLKAERESPIPEVQKMIAPGFKLRPYQNEAVRFFKETNGNVLLGDEMGTGKTIMSLAYLATEGKKAVVISPKTAIRGWVKESVKFFPSYFKPIELNPAELRKDYAEVERKYKGDRDVPVQAALDLQAVDDKWINRLKEKNLASINYESLEKFRPLLEKAGFDTVVVDESQRMINPKAKVTKSIQRLAKNMRHKILMSGTAIKNKKWELFTQLDLIAPGKYKTKEALKNATIGGLWEDMKDVYLARAKSSVLKDLPPKTTTISEHDVVGIPDYEINPDGSKAIVDGKGHTIKDRVDVGDIAWLKNQIALGKADATIDLAKEVMRSSDSKMLIFSDSVEVAEKIANQLGDKALLHHGGMSQDDREAAKDEFQRQNDFGEFVSPKRVLVSTRQSLAVAATLTAADKVIFNDLPWTAADVRQAEDRTHRIGQKNSVNVYWVTASNNIFDSSVTEIVKRKYALGVKVNQGRKLTDEELKWMTKKITLDDIVKNLSGERRVHGDDTDLNEGTEAAPKEVPIEQGKTDKEKTIEALDHKISTVKDKLAEMRKTGKGAAFGLLDESPGLKDIYKRYQYAVTHNAPEELVKEAKLAWLERKLEDIKDYISSPGIPVGDMRDVRRNRVTEGKDKKEPVKRTPVKEVISMGFNWDTLEGKRTVVGKLDSGEYLVTYPGKTADHPHKEILSADDISFEIKREKGRENNRAASAAKEAEEKQNLATKQNTYGFTDSMPPARKAKAIGTLLSKIMINGELQSRKSYIEDSIKNGAYISTVGGNRVLKHKNGNFLFDKDITKTAIDYAEFLINKRVKRTPVLDEAPKKRGRPPKPESVKQAESDLSLVSAKKVKLKKVKSDQVHDYYKPNIELDEDDAKIAMQNLRDDGINIIIIPGKNSVVKIRKGFAIDELEDRLSKSLSGGKWIGVDLDGTLAEYTDWKGPEHIGKPIPMMVNRVKRWLAAGKDVKIMTARANPDNEGKEVSDKAIDAIHNWCEDVFGKRLEVTYKKDTNMLELWDDRAVGVKLNTGVRI